MCVGGNCLQTQFGFFLTLSLNFWYLKALVAVAWVVEYSILAVSPGMTVVTSWTKVILWNKIMRLNIWDENRGNGIKLFSTLIFFTSYYLPLQIGQHFPSSTILWFEGQDSFGQSFSWSIREHWTCPSLHSQEWHLFGTKTSPCVKKGVNLSSGSQGAKTKEYFSIS